MTLTSPLSNTQRLNALLLFIGSAFISLSSLGFEHIGGFQPCQLCYLQRHTHYAMVPLAAILILAIRLNAPAPFVRLMLLALSGLLLFGAGVGFYQAGAEWEFWLGPSNCANTVEITPNAANLLQQLQKTELISCSVAQIRILGLSFGGWNAVLSTILVAIGLVGALGKEESFGFVFRLLPFLKGWLNKLYGMA